jgi:hypothetical protein
MRPPEDHYKPIYCEVVHEHRPFGHAKVQRYPALLDKPVKPPYSGAFLFALNNFQCC